MLVVHGTLLVLAARLTAVQEGKEWLSNALHLQTLLFARRVLQETGGIR